MRTLPAPALPDAASVGAASREVIALRAAQAARQVAMAADVPTAAHVRTCAALARAGAAWTGAGGPILRPVRVGDWLIPAMATVDSALPAGTFTVTVDGIHSRCEAFGLVPHRGAREEDVNLLYVLVHSGMTPQQAADSIGL